MWGVNNDRFMTCPHCGLRVYIGTFWRPVSCTEREADDHVRPAFLITGGDHLLHRCRIAQYELSL